MGEQVVCSKIDVLIVGSGPSGMAVAACLKQLNISATMIEKEACNASLWKLRTYDRLKLHLAKRFCALPHSPFPSHYPTYIPRDLFIRYLDDYVDRFRLFPKYYTLVESASYDGASSRWHVVCRSVETGVESHYKASFLVVASGENNQAFIPEIEGLKSFLGPTVHSSVYKSGKEYTGKKILVVGCGNSGMEIAYDLANHGAKTHISIRSKLHVLNKELVHMGMLLLKLCFPVFMVDCFVGMIASLLYGDLSKYGIIKPALGPFAGKGATGRSPVIDVGTIAKIKSGEIKVVKEPVRITGDEVEFSDGKSHCYDAIVFATGYRSGANGWLKDYDSLLGDDGFPKNRFPNHWKGSNGLYCVGLGRMGLAGVSRDAQNVANDIKKCLQK